MVIRRLHIRTLALLLLLLMSSMTKEAWATKVTYHILTLPLNSSSGNTLAAVDGKRVEALRVIVDETSPKVGLPAHFKSPLATGFTYYNSDNVIKNGGGSNRSKIYEYMTTTYDLYEMIASPTPLVEGSAIDSNCDIYVTYTYNASNGIVKLDGTQQYNIKLGDRFLCFNKDRANRPGAMLASIPTEEDLINEDFSYFAAPGFNGNKNHYFHFRFVLEGEDPYNITLRTAYNGNETFRESDKALNKTVTKWYKGASLFCQGKDNGSNNLWLSSDDHKQYTQTDASGEVTYVDKPGFYRGGNGGTAEMNPIWNSFAMLNADHGDGYVFMGSKINSNGNNWQPTSDGRYFYLTGNIDSGNNPRFQLKKPAQAESTDPEIYEVRQYTYKVKTPLSNTILSATVEISEYNSSAAILSHIPEALKRKYVTFSGAYQDEALSSTLMTTFADVEAANNNRTIWLKYDSNMPFNSLPVGGSYTDAQWYTIRLNGQAENQYVAFYDTENGNQFSTGRGSNTVLHQGENSAEAQVAFIGDPFELKIINRKTSETAEANRYIGCTTDAADATALTSQTGTSDISSWEIVSDDVSGTMALRQLGTFAAPKYIGWNYVGEGRPMSYNSTASRMKVVELEKKSYIYHIVRNDAGDIAIKATDQQDVGIPLKFANIPEIIRSPFLGLPGVTITYYWTLDDAKAKTNPHTNAPYDVTAESNKDIYVRYDMGTALSGGSVKLDNSQSYNVRLNGEFIYYSEGTIKSKATITDDEAQSTDAFLWRLEGGDPYSMIIYNGGANEANNSAAYIQTTFEDNAALTFGAMGTAAKFIAKSSTTEGVYEVMAATGDDIDASEEYYNIGRNTTNTVRMYKNTTYAHGYTQLRFLLTPKGSSAVIYHLMDKAGNDLLQVRSRRADLYFPADYRSPLVETYHYWTTSACNVTLSDLASAEVEDGLRQIYVTYDTSDRINLQKGAMYLLKFEGSQTLYALENGSDGFSDPVKAIYPYCNGDCNFFVYGQDQYDLQQEGAASTRTRWAWYLESANNDPYHVKICSRQLETYNSTDNRGYFCTYVENFSYPNEDAANHVITGLVWPGITGDRGTEYMILGNVGQYQLVTTEMINDGTTNERRTVKSFEQYWKTFDTIRKKVFGDTSSANINSPTTVPETPLYSVTSEASESSNRSYLEKVKGFHHYMQWAYAKRWNGYNISGKTSKGWEDIEHWYQTIDMGEGYFDLVKTTIDPALILLDQHGWEIMRKPLPSSPDEDPAIKAAKYNAIRPYDSPMVKEYIFWSSAKKRTGFHQYYLMDKRIGGDYTSTSLTNLPPYGSENVLDAKGNLNDQYVTYIVKDEYAQSYVPNSQAGAPFLIQQGDHFASNDETATIKTNDVPTGGMQQYIVENIGTIYNTGNDVLWYIKPNPQIDTEMGYTESNHDWGTSTPNAYDNSPYSTNRVAVIIEGGSSDATIKKYGRFSFSNGFDPYNIQITSTADNTKCFVTNASGATLDEGDMEGTYSTTPSVTLGASATGVNPIWYDGLRLNITNTTFMAVQDAEGNMQLMPRFDQDRRVRDFGKIETPVEQVGDANKLKEMQTQLFRPMVYNYRIIDNEGNESLRYLSAGEITPQIPDHFKSPLAKDFQYYTDVACTNEITSSLAGDNHLTYTDNDPNHNVIYVRYAYDEEADVDHILKGNWFTMQLNEKNAISSSGIKEATDDKPDPVNGDDKSWQWKFLETRSSDPDPYAIYLFNRSQKDVKQPDATRFALLPHTASGTYALAEAGKKTYTYLFLNGRDMNTTTAATIAEEPGFKSMSCSFNGTDSQVKLMDDVEHTYNYRVYTDGGVFAISADQSQAEASQNAFVPTIPEAARTPLLEPEDFLFYEAESDMGDAAKELEDLYGLYEDVIYVRYKPYNELTTTFKVPNDKTIEDGHVARGSGSNDSPLGLNANLLYNIVWYNDNMMKNDGDAVKGKAGQGLQAEAAYEWQLEGNDPYAIKIKSVGSGKYVNSSASLSDEAQTFMLIPQTDYDYGVLAVTGNKANKLTMADDGNAETEEALSITDTDSPAKYIIFALATHKVIYHLVIATTNSTVTIPYRASMSDGETTKEIKGSTQRDLTSNTGEEGALAGDKYQLGSTINGQTYSYDAGHISLGDKLEVPSVFHRPNVVYHFFVEGVYTNDDCDRTAPSHVASLDATYRGLEVGEMGREEGLLGKTVRINIVYSFNESLETNSGNDFVRDVADNKWYTIETKANDGTPWLAQYTNAWGLEVKEGRGTRYTNDYLWSPLGDPYGFKLYNRYIYKNSGASNSGEKYREITSATFADNQTLTLSNPNNYAPDDVNYSPDANAVFELLDAPTPGYFRVHPVVNNSGTQYYFKTVDDGVDGIHVKLSTTATEFTFGLTEELMKPFYDLAGYVGGLNETGKAAYEAANGDLMKLQQIVYDDQNIIPFTPGYYRLHSPAGIEGIGTRRYASGYTHKVELTGGVANKPIPMHFYEREGTETTFELLPSKDGSSTGKGFTTSAATRGELPIPSVEYDPASIFYITGTMSDAKLSTQGLYVKGEKGKQTTDVDEAAEGVGERAIAYMTEAEGDASTFWIMDIGGAVMLIHDQTIPKYRKYLSYDQNDENHIYDLKLTHNTHTDHAKWCLQPVNNIGLYIKTHSGGDDSAYGTSRNYASFYAPFDILLPDDGTDKEEGENYIRTYQAYICDDVNSPWDLSSSRFDLHPKPIGRYNVAPYATNNKFVPAGTPVLLAMCDQSDYVPVTIPTSKPSASLLNGITYTYSDASSSCNNILKGEYLEQKLTEGCDVYVLGMPINATKIEKAENYETTGDIDAVLTTSANTGLGFYLNANPNKELGPSRGNWTRNNWYVYNNKVYYRGAPSPAREVTRGIEFIPVLFDVGEEEAEEDPSGISQNSDYPDGVYDLSGRRVATEQQVKDGTWRQNLAPGIYIIHGRKVKSVR